jgi:hypothetical protein
MPITADQYILFIGDGKTSCSKFVAILTEMAGRLSNLRDKICGNYTDAFLFSGKYGLFEAMELPHT